jgi:DNA-binding NarL/FixJ family response regulator
MADTPESHEQLTPREIEVLQLIAQGFSNPRIAEKLSVSEETVKTHVRHLLGKLGVASRTEAVAVGFRTRLIS